MHLPIHLLSLGRDRAGEFKSRWSGPEGSSLLEQLTGEIKNGAGQAFMEAGVSFLGPRDLRGITLADLDIEFPDGGGFYGMDFSYADFMNCTFSNAEIQGRFELASFRDCRFVKCTFRASVWIASRFAGCRFEDCVFVDDSLFEACRFQKTGFKRFAADGIIFDECSMDSNCVVDDPKVRKAGKTGEAAADTPGGPSDAGVSLARDKVSGFYASVSSAYGAAGANGKKRDYYFKANDAETDYQSTGLRKIGRRLIGDITGYGVRPARIAFVMLLVVLIFALTFWRLTTDLYGGFVLSFAGLFTMVSIAGVPWPYDWLFIVEGLLGMALFGLYIVSVANVWFDR